MSAILAETRADEATAVAEPPRRERKRVVIIGGGFAGIAAARALRRADVDVILIDRRNHHIFQPLLYQVATAVLSPAEIAAPIRQLEVKQKNLSVLLAEVTSIDVASRTIEASSPGAGALNIAYDYLVVATGMRPSYFGHDEFAQYAPGLKNLSDAETIRAKILGAFELAATTEDESERARQMTFVLVGAGPTGVELAASLAQMVKVTLSGNFGRIDPAEANIILLDAGKRVLSTFAESLSRRATRRLEKLGVKILTDVKVETVDAQGVVAGGNRIPSATVLWTAGVAASPIPTMLGTKTDRAGRALVDPFLKVAEAPGVFVAGDAASVMQKNEHPVPGVAQAAIQEGHYVGRLIAKELKGGKVKRPFSYFDKGSMAVVGRNYAVLERGWLRTSGALTWLVWAFVHVLALPQLQNRWRVQHQWLWSYFTGQRSSRLIPEPPRDVAPARNSREGHQPTS
ncbi:pyridine nucleotide-disulfide oxidoreductase [Bradyrhizobium pachyrhizi]|uniref:NADH:ubiquinone reductase (non-electrogenic) n=1 Tax=Bradyrhizobium brasilense TaxID=1419277 RepID=A0ABY8JMT3_9BRAD|nr:MULTISPECIES: NAD(P)/FAD-dependent oxidoreductase [Bradyrhizobium]KRP85488.1 pyridine nucleotide-disulfide oxidoreductase [Bradyrhizobium pachyrhizi]WFU66109.1 NAD(P)/FAD-dependent oxidoreductase [Bradyrhizobium brasilense]